MDEPTQDAAEVRGIDLAQEADFDLGPLHVRPAICEVESNGAPQVLQRRVMQVLVALAQARGAVISQDDLVARCWRGLAVTDDAIFRCIGKLRKLAAEYPDAPFAIETIPGVGYRLTSSDFVEDAPISERARLPHRRFHFPARRAAAVFAILAVVTAAIWLGRSRSLDQHSTFNITVQPFETLTDSGEVHSLARRTSNEIVDALGDSQIQAVLGGEQADATGRQASLIVTGRAREDGPTTNVDVRIEDGTTHAALWAMEFKRESGAASDLPLEIAARVADEAKIVSFARGANPPLADNSALSALLQVADMIRDPRAGAWAEMIDRAQALVARYPKFAFGHDVLAVAYFEAAQNIDLSDRARAMADAARNEANLTLRLDPEDAGAYVVLSDLEPAYNFRAREAILLRGIRLSRHPKEPLGGLYSSDGRLLDDVGRLRESLSLKLVAHATDEWGAPKTAQLARAYANMGNLPAAKEWLQKGAQLWPNHSGIRRVRQYVAGFYEQPSDALAVLDSLDKQATLDQSNAIWRSYVEAKTTHSEQAIDAAVRRIQEAADQGKVPREIEIMMIAGVGEPERAIQAANSAIDRQALQPWFLFTPVTRNLRRDPGFVRLAARMGLIKYWRETGKRPDFCTDPASASECSPQLLAALKA